MIVKPKKNKEIKSVYNPYRKYDVGLKKHISMMELYLTDRELFNKIANGDYPGLKMSKRMRTFFRTIKVRGQSYDKDMEVLKNAWENFRVEKPTAIVKKVNKKYEKDGIDKLLLSKTMEGIVKWDIILDSHNLQSINKKYQTNFYDTQWTFSVIGYKKEYNEWHYHYELRWTNKYGESNILENPHNGALYKAIEKKKIKKTTKPTNPYLKPTKKKKERQIKNGDFVVRTNLFRCFYQEHLVEEITGVIKVVDKQGKIITRKVPGAYCPKCNCYYLLTSQYKKLKESGILLCQLIDGETYYKKGKLENFNAASESLLMQNGYNVKSNNGLTDIQRQMILQNIMDNKILTPHRISSYLEMFIAQKKNMPQYREAILKWEKDKNFVLAYKNGNKKNINIQSIKSGR